MEELDIIIKQDEQPLSKYLASPAIVKRIELACGKRTGSLITNIYNAAAANPDIWNCEPMSVINAALDAETCGLSLSPAMGESCILPYKKWKRGDGGRWEVESIRASFIPMKRGLKQMALRTDKYRILNAFTVYEGQSWVEDQLTGIGHIDGFMSSKKAVGYGAYLEFFTGYKATDYMSLEEMKAHVTRYSPSWDKKEKKIKDGTKWATDFDMMAEGVILKRLIRHKGVIDAKSREVLDRVDAEVSGEVTHENIIEVPPEDIQDAAPVARRSESENMNDLGFGDTLSPVQKEIVKYEKLCKRAGAVNIRCDTLPAQVTIEQVRAAYAELLNYVDQAEQQAAA